MTKLAYVGHHRPNVNSTEKYVADALESLGHEVVRVHEPDADYRLLADRLRAWNVDTCFWTRTPSFRLPADEQADFVKLCAKRGITTVGLHLDKYFGLARETDVYEHPFFRCDYVFTADGGADDKFAAAGVRHHWWRPAVAASQCGRGRFRAEYAAPIAFVGSARYHREWPWRQQLIKHLNQTYHKRFRQFGRSGDRLADDQLADAYASIDVVVGDSCLAGGRSMYYSNRIPETLGRGGFLLHPYVEGIDEWYRHNEHLVFYEPGDCRALTKLIDEWRFADPIDRWRISETGMCQVMATETFEVRMTEVLVTLGIPAPEAVTHA